MFNDNCARSTHVNAVLRPARWILAVALLILLAACGGEPQPRAQAPDTAAAPDAVDAQAPVSGGWVRVGAPSEVVDTFNPFFAQGLADWIGLWAMYDTLVWLVGSEVEYGLAESVTPNEDGSEWTIVLKDATFHDGSPVRPQDVAYSFATFADPMQAPFFAQFFANVNVASISFPDDRTLVVPLYTPQGDFLERTLATLSIVVPEGSIGGTNAIGSGPFKLEAYEAGKSIRLVRNEDYWAGEAPLLDGIEVIVINDPNARLNALKSGEIDYAAGVPPATARAEADNPDIVIVPAGVANSTAHAFAANTTLPPFDNPNVVRALKLVVDREALVNTVLFGFGEVGNDIVGKGLAGYNDSLPQVERDVAEARRLFAEAGVTELTILTAEVYPGTTAAAELLAQQLAEVGVTLTLDELPPDQFFGDFMRLLSTPLQSTIHTNRPAGVHAALMTGAQGGFNITGMAGEEYDALLIAMTTEVDPERRLQLSLEVQAYLHEHDGMIVWAFQEDINAATPGLSGVIYSQSAPRFHRASLAE